MPAEQTMGKKYCNYSAPLTEDWIFPAACTFKIVQSLSRSLDISIQYPSKTKKPLRRQGAE